MSRLRVPLLLVAGVALLSGCDAGPTGGPAGVRVFAAASLADVLPTLLEAAEAPDAMLSLGATSGLARQIRDGAPADVFISADRKWIEYLRSAGCLEDEPREIAGNRLVCIAPPDSSMRARNATELANALTRGERVGIAVEGVPAGDYARAALKATNTEAALTPRLVGLGDVRSVLRAVIAGEVAAGFTYATDAQSADLPPLFVFDEATHPPIRYFAARIAGRPRGDRAAAVVERLTAPSIQKRLTTLGFTPRPQR